jgi:predicted ester cyclase
MSNFGSPPAQPEVYPGLIKIVPVYEKRVTVERESFPDLNFTVEDQIAEGDKVVTR